MISVQQRTPTEADQLAKAHQVNVTDQPRRAGTSELSPLLAMRWGAVQCEACRYHAMVTCAERDGEVYIVQYKAYAYL